MKNPSLFSVFPFISIFEKKEDKEDNFKKEARKRRFWKKRGKRGGVGCQDNGNVKFGMEEEMCCLLKGTMTDRRNVEKHFR